MDPLKKISIVFSVFNEKEILDTLFARVSQSVSSLPYRFELVFVDDGSMDGSDNVIRRIQQEPQTNLDVTLISLSRNFGHEAAMISGIDHASGEAIICMDADLQHPPEVILEMLSCFESGMDVVTMIRTKIKGTKRPSGFLSILFYRLINKISPFRLQENASDFFLISKKVASILRKDFRERNRFLRGIIQIVGFRSASVTYTAPSRFTGKSKYSFLKLSALTLTAITSFSKTPLFLGLWFGFIFSLASIILGIYTLWTYFFGVTPPSGYTTIILFLSICFAILFFLVGIIGIYVGYLFEEQKNRPIYIVSKLENQTNNPSSS
jgi:glycosyltransferase involved in cell wall biosynthesis